MPALFDPPKVVAHAFVNAINGHDLDALERLMTENHAFIDSLGARTEGRQKMKSAWERYFRMVPDYSVAVEEVFAEEPVVVLLGTAQGTYSADGELLAENRWTTHAAWRAVVRGSAVAEWRVYADNEPIRQVMARHRK